MRAPFVLRVWGCRCAWGADGGTGSFLDAVERVAAFEYVPTTDDVLRARLETQGVEEPVLLVEGGECARRRAAVWG